MTRATNSASMRSKNEKMILSLIHKSPISRAEIAKRTGLTKAAVTVIAEELIGRGILKEQAAHTRSVGRTPVLLSLNTDAVYAVGVNITRREVTLGVVDLAGRTLLEDSFPTAAPSLTVKTVAERLSPMLDALSLDPMRVCRLSVVTPGPVDIVSGVIKNPPAFDAWHGFAVAPSLAAATGLPTVLGNVSGAMALAERYFGAARGVERFLALLVDDGIGAGLVMGDELFLGPCELGHITVRLDGERCECGNYGCLERYASVPRILAGTRYGSWREAVDAADGEVLAREAEYLGAAVVSANNMFDFDALVLCGALAYRASPLLSLMKERIKARVLSKSDFRVLSGEVGSRLLVAAALGIHDFLH